MTHEEIIKLMDRLSKMEGEAERRATEYQRFAGKCRWYREGLNYELHHARIFENAQNIGKLPVFGIMMDFAAELDEKILAEKAKETDKAEA